MNFLIWFNGFNLSPFSSKLFLIDFAVANELSLSPCMHTESISQGICFPTGSKMEEAAKKLNIKIACEIFADRNYEDDGNLVSRKKPHALITDPEEAK